MKMYFSKQQKLIIMAVGALFVVFVLFFQFYFLSPIKTELKMKQRAWQSNQKLVEVLLKKKDPAKQNTSGNTYELQKQLPVKPLQDQLILDLQKVETMSDNEILSMDFLKNVVQETSAAESMAASGTLTTQENSETSEQSLAAGKQQIDKAKPAGLKKITAQLTVQAPNYEAFETFIGNLESLKRFVIIENIQYTGPDEINDVNQGNEEFIYTLSISSFYMDNLPDLAADLPKIDVPVPAGKTNPLSRFPDISAQGKSE